MESVGLWHILLALAIFSLIIEVFTLGFLAGALGCGTWYSVVLGRILNWTRNGSLPFSHWALLLPFLPLSPWWIAF